MYLSRDLFVKSLVNCFLSSPPHFSLLNPLCVWRTLDWLVEWLRLEETFLFAVCYQIDFILSDYCIKTLSVYCESWLEFLIDLLLIKRLL
jgi:hypothetical protein